MKSADSILLSPTEERWKKWEICCKQCRRCALSKTRKQVVLGRGARRASLLILGEAPGAQEDEEGLPFVGRSGKLLQQMLTEVGFLPESYYITNVVKCRPPANRRPRKEEVACCSLWLEEQLELLQPSWILTLGATAYEYLQGEKPRMTQIRGRWQKTKKGVEVLPTFHPAYLLRSPSHKKEFQEDLLQVFRCYQVERCGNQDR